MKRKMALIGIICAFCVLSSSFQTFAAETASIEPTLIIVNDGLVGWENWKSENYKYGKNNFYKLYCPYKDTTVEEIFFYINKLISENMGILNERYGESLYNPTSIHLIFDWPDFGEQPDEASSKLAKYLNAAKSFYNGIPVEFIMWKDEKEQCVSQIEIALSNNKSWSWADHRYNQYTGAYERTDIEFYDDLNEIVEYQKFGTRTGSWVQNESALYSFGMYNLTNVFIIQSYFEILDAVSFDRSVLDQPYTQINSPGKTEGHYVLVKHLSIIDTEPILRAKIRDLCEQAKKASDSQTEQLKYINDYLCSNVEYDYDFYEWIQSGQNTPPYESENGVVPNNAYGALVDGLAICSGFSHVIGEVCNYLGIPNFYIDNETHVWNMVYVDEKWKMLDVTWNATGNDTSKYFLVEAITETSGSHTYNFPEVEAAKVDTLLYWEQKNKWDKYFDYVEHQKMIKRLVDIGIFNGNENGELNLQIGLTRAELAALLTRLTGQEKQVKDKNQYYAMVSPFEDVPTWAVPYVGYCYEQGLLKGYSDKVFGSYDTVNVRMACTVILRYLNYTENDWEYSNSVEKVKSIGIMPDYWPTGTTALRNDIAILINYALDNQP